jgi:hypothetical protein
MRYAHYAIYIGRVKAGLMFACVHRGVDPGGKRWRSLVTAPFERVCFAYELFQIYVILQLTVLFFFNYRSCVCVVSGEERFMFFTPAGSEFCQHHLSNCKVVLFWWKVPKNQTVKAYKGSRGEAPRIINLMLASRFGRRENCADLRELR